MEKNKHIGLRIDEETHAGLKELAEYEGRSINGEILYLIRQAVREYQGKIGGGTNVLIFSSSRVSETRFTAKRGNTQSCELRIPSFYLIYCFFFVSCFFSASSVAASSSA